ncbi:hypothetical protein MMC31_002184 [Peltigera leucophlebia]|nr:hypothetical protein [Peltigera leucophlebia]
MLSQQPLETSSNAFPSMAPKTNTRPGLSGTQNPNSESKSQLQQTPYELPPILPDRTTSCLRPIIGDQRKPATGSEPAITKTEPAPVFALSGPFSGSDGLPASRWLKKLQYDLKPSYPPHHPSYPREYVNALDVLLVGEAAEWAEENPLVQTRINKADPTLEDVEALKTLLQDRFPQRLTEITTFNINAELESLKQQSDENLLTYYKRAKSMMERVGARDRAESGTPLTPLEAAPLDTVMRSFVKGIHDMGIKKAAARGLTSATKSFSALYIIVEEARCIKVEVEKLEAAEAKDAELQYYKNLAEKRLQSSSPSQAYNPQSNAFPSVAPKSNTRPGLGGTQNPNPESKSQLQQTPYELPPNLPDRTTSCLRPIIVLTGGMGTSQVLIISSTSR